MPKLIAAIAVVVLAGGAGAWFLRPHDTVDGCEKAVTRQVDAAIVADRDAPEAKGLPECDGLSAKEAEGVADRVVQAKLGDLAP